MFHRLLVAWIVPVVVIAQAPSVSKSSKGQVADSLLLPKQTSLYDDYDLNDPKLLGNTVEGSGGAASLDEYADDDDEEEQLPKVTARTTVTTTTTTTSTTTSMTTTATRSKSTSILTTVRRISSNIMLTNRWTKSTMNNLPQKKNENTTPFNDLDVNEFKDDHEDYVDDLEDDAYYNEPTLTTRTTLVVPLATRLPISSTRNTPIVQQRTPVWALFSFLTRPPIAAGILAGLGIGILTSIVLLICIVRRFQKRDKSHSSYTTGLLYPNQYGYTKTPQEFYA